MSLTSIRITNIVQNITGWSVLSQKMGLVVSRQLPIELTLSYLKAPQMNEIQWTLFDGFVNI